MLTYCPICKEDTLAVTDSVYDGFKKTGERTRCGQCGHEFTSPSKTRGVRTVPAHAPNDPLAALFGDSREEEKLDLFDVEAETGRLCRRCAYYVLHPFTQRCGLHDREVSATDTCGQFEKNLNP
ncbi:MAG: hypothetical protein WD708_01860 [Kiritimatiellia bacterium]